MAWNTTHTRFYSTDLAGLECGSYLKIPRRDRTIRKAAIYNGDLEIGQCVAMVRVPAGARIVGGRVAAFSGTTAAQNAYLAVGDPYACGRLIGAFQPGAFSGGSCGSYDCFAISKIGNIGDGCGLFYQYTCETDIVVTNLYRKGNANEGGWVGGSVAAGAEQSLSTKWTGGRIFLSIEYLDAS